MYKAQKEYCLIYTSERTAGFKESDLYDILNSAVDFNFKNNITGFLLAKNNSFLQYLEGTDLILQLFNKIKDDPRHKKVDLIKFCELKDGRICPNWKMGFKDVSNDKLEHIFNNLFEGFGNNALTDLLHELNKKVK